ncbi:MAG: hypothetical protein NVSMB47_00830 [Polyangiales bacterium]
MAWDGRCPTGAAIEVDRARAAASTVASDAPGGRAIQPRRPVFPRPAQSSSATAGPSSTIGTGPGPGRPTKRWNGSAIGDTLAARADELAAGLEEG